MLGACGQLTVVFLSWEDAIGELRGKPLALPEFARGGDAYANHVGVVLLGNEAEWREWVLLQFLNELLAFLQDGGQHFSDLLGCYDGKI